MALFGRRYSNTVNPKGEDLMALHIDELRILVEDLEDLRGGQIQNISNLDHDLHWILQIRIPGETVHVRVLLDRRFGRVSRCANVLKSKNNHPSSFTMLLRKWIVGARVDDVCLINEDRIVQLKLHRGEEELSWIIELTGFRQNALLLVNEIVLKSASPDERLKSGHAYHPPTGAETTTKLSPLPQANEIEARATRDYEVLAAEDARNSLDQRLRAGIKRLVRRIRNIESDLGRAEDSDLLRHRADLLQSAYGKVKKGQTSVRVVDYTNDMKELDIDIPPDLELRDFIARLYHDYKRLKQAKGLIEERLLQAMEELSHLEKLRVRVASAAPDELQNLAHDLRGKQALPKKQTRQSMENVRIPFREFRTSKGSIILVGRSAKDNDTMRTRHSRGNDIWLHARDWAGSHVILKVAAPEGEELLEAALLAAFFSKGRNDSLVDVTWTHVKHIRKVKGGAPGLVTVAGGSTITVVPKGSKLERVLESEITQA